MIKTEYRIIDEFDNKLTKSAIKINNIIIFKSNKIVSNGEDKLIFYNLNNRNILTTNIDKDKKQYSFIYLANGLTLLPINGKMSNNRLLLCACKKYLKFQKNGILLLSFEENNNISNSFMPINYTFYNTNNFEVFCFCPITIKSDYEQIINVSVKKDKIYSDYFFVGGFDLFKKEGIIKLFKVIYSEKLKKNRIEFIQDISFFQKEKCKRFNGPISCITQSNIDNKILVTCWDGNIYLFESPDIKDYLEYDMKVNNKISFKKFFQNKKNDR